jgi:radical SAM protein with 4Fe4S-binding SPASM domain
VLSLFDGETDMQQIALRLTELLGQPLEKARKIIEKVVERRFTPEAPVLVRTEAVPDGDWSVYDPAGMCIPPKDFKPVKRLDAPLSLLLMPSNSCSTDCVYCYAERKPVKKSELLPVSRWKELIEEASAAGVDIASFSGGDPLQYHGIVPLMDKLIEKDFRFLVPTKTYVSPSFAAGLADMGFGTRYFQISIDAWTGELADSMVRRPGYRDLAVKSITNLVHHGIQVRTNTVCTPMNYRDVPALLEHLAELGVKRSSVALYGKSIYRHNDSLFMREKDILWLKGQIERLKNRFPDYSVSFNGTIIDHSKMPARQKARRWKARAHCSGGTSAMTICADGRVILCEQMPQNARYSAGDLKRQGILEVWNSPRLKALAAPPREKFRHTACFDCSEFDECHYQFGYCFRDSLNAYGTIYSPPPNCPQAPPAPRFA